MISTTITVNSTEMALLATATAATTVTDMGLVIMRLRSSWELFSSTVSMAVVAVTIGCSVWPVRPTTRIYYMLYQVRIIPPCLYMDYFDSLDT